jgi:hypothetical protein
MEDLHRDLLPPPLLLPHGELRATIEPPLRDLAPFPGQEMVDEWEPFESGPAEDQLPEDLVRRAQTIALANEHVKRLLTSKRYISIGASLLDGDDKKAASLLFIFYNYTDNLTIEVMLDRTAQEVGSVAEMRYQPPPPQQEIDQAIALARQDRRLAELVTDDLEGTAVLVSPVDPKSPYYSHRQFNVGFGCPDERLPRITALVDLSAETVIKVGSDCAKESQQQGGEQ